MRAVLAASAAHDLGGIRLWAGIVAHSETDPAQIIARNATTRLRGELIPLSGSESPKNVGVHGACRAGRQRQTLLDATLFAAAAGGQREVVDETGEGDTPHRQGDAEDHLREHSKLSSWVASRMRYVATPKVVDTAIQVHGALGVTDDTILSYWYRHERAARIYDGADEVHKTTLGRRILQRHRTS